MSFWKSLFGVGKGNVAREAAPLREAEHKGFRIAAQPFAEGGQFQTAGVISKVIDGHAKEHRFVRADRFATPDEAAEFSLLKARQIIDQQGDRLFD